MKTRVFVITPDNFPPDIRIEREVRTLVNAGYEVFICASDETPTHYRTLNYHGAKVVYIGYRKFKGIPLLDWRKIFSILYEVQPDIIHIHNPQLYIQILVAIKKSRRKIKVIFDDHELWTIYSLFYKTTPLLKLLLVLLFFILEFTAVKLSDIVITVSENMKKILVKLFRINENKVFSIENFEDIDMLSSLSSSSLLIDFKKDGDFIICYMGGTEEHRGLKYLFQSLTYLKKDVVDRLRILIIGPMSKSLRENLLRLPTHISMKIFVTGFLPLKVALNYLKCSDIAVITYEKNPYTMYALPNKLCIYLYAKKPVIATKLSALETYFDGSIYFVPEPKPHMLAEAISNLYQDENMRNKLSMLGYRLVIRKNNWKTISKKLLKIYKSLETKRDL